MKVSRWSFSRGSRLVGKLEPQEARMIHDALVVNGRLRPVALPDHGEVYQTTRNAGSPPPVYFWREKGRSILAPRRRSTVSLMSGYTDVVAYTEERLGMGVTTWKIVGGSTMPVGLPRPKFPPTAGAVSAVIQPQLSAVSLGSGHWDAGTVLYYRIIPVGPYGMLAPTPSLEYTVPAGSNANVQLICPRLMGGLTFWGYKVARSKVKGEEKVIGETSITAGGYSFTDSGQDDTGIKASDYDNVATVSQYLTTFAANEGIREFESAPSPLSKEISLQSGVPLIVDLANDGYWEQDGLRSAQVSALFVQGPVTAGRAAGATVPTFDLGSVLTEVFDVGVTLATSYRPGFISGCGVRLRYGTAVGFAEQAKAKIDENGQVYPYGIIFPEQGADLRLQLADGTQVRPNLAALNHGGTVATHAWDAAFGAKRVFLTSADASIARAEDPLCPHSLCSGERILCYTLNAEDKVDKRCSVTFIRDNSTENMDAGWVVGDIPWDWTTTPSIFWCRDLVHILMEPDQAFAYSGVKDGTLVKVEHPDIGFIIGRAKMGPSGLYLVTDTHGFEQLSLTGVNNLKISWYENNNGIRGRAFYRVADTGEFLRTGLLPLDETYFVDNVPTQLLGQAITSHRFENGIVIQDEAPPIGMRNLIAHHNGLAGITTNGTVRLSRPGNIDAWPPAFEFVPKDFAVGLASFNDGLLIFCRNSMWRLDGNEPTRMRLTKTAVVDGCRARNSIIVTPSGVLFFGARGICVTDGHTSHSLTMDKIKPWQFFPARQMVGTGGVDAGTAVGLHIMDTTKGAGAAWVAAMESAAVLEALAVDGAFGLAPREWDLLAEEAIAFYHRGRYGLFVPADKCLEGHGTWILDLGDPAKPLTHLGLQPLSVAVDGDELWLLLPGGQSSVPIGSVDTIRLSDYISGLDLVLGVPKNYEPYDATLPIENPQHPIDLIPDKKVW